MDVKEVDQELRGRARTWEGFEPKASGVLGLFTREAAPLNEGASMLK